jgi:hypothetical protein
MNCSRLVNCNKAVLKLEKEIRLLGNNDITNMPERPSCLFHYSFLGFENFQPIDKIFSFLAVCNVLYVYFI